MKRASAVGLALPVLVVSVLGLTGSAAAAQKWGDAVVGADGGVLETCRAAGRVHVRGDNRRGTRGIVVRARMIRNYFGDGRRRSAGSVSRRVARGRTSRAGSVPGARTANDVVRLHLRRFDGSGTLTWFVKPSGLPRCAMRPRRRNWDESLASGRARLQHCQALVGGIYGPVWRIWGRGNNGADERYEFGMAVERGEQTIGEWRVDLDPGEVSRTRVLHASVLLGDRASGGLGSAGGGLGGEIDPTFTSVC